MKQVVRGLGTALCVLLLIRFLDWLLAPLLVPLMVLTLLIALFAIAIMGPGGFKK
jgi:hypothetical protein